MGGLNESCIAFYDYVFGLMGLNGVYGMGMLCCEGWIGLLEIDLISVSLVVVGLVMLGEIGGLCCWFHSLVIGV